MKSWNGAILTHLLIEVSTTNKLFIGFMEFISYQPMIICTLYMTRCVSVQIEAGNEFAHEQGKQC